MLAFLMHLDVMNLELLTQSPSCLPCGIPISSNVAGPCLLGALLGLLGAEAALGTGLGL